MRLFLVRHPQPAIEAGICYGSTDLALAPQQLDLVLASLTALESVLPDNVGLFSSPLRRCAELALRLPCASRTFDDRLVEINFGDWEMRPWDAIPRAEIDAWAGDLVHYRPGGGESVLQMAVRVAAFHAQLQRLPQQQSIVVCHAGVIRLLAACQSGLSLPEMALQAARTPHKIGYGEVTILDC